MSASSVQRGAWGGDPARKQASIARARAALVASPVVTYDPSPRLGDGGQASDASNVYCAAFGTADPAELEARAGLPVSTLMLASAALSACEYWVQDGGRGRRTARLIRLETEAPLAALEAIPVGADPLGLARRYVVDLFGKVVGLRDRHGRGLTREQQALVHQLVTLHDEGCADPAAFRGLRRAATVATDTANGELATTVLRFVESAAWPLAGLVSELPGLTRDLHVNLRSNLAPDGPSPAEQSALDALSAVYREFNARLKADQTLDIEAEVARIEATPEFAAVYEPAFKAQLESYDRAAVTAYVPFAVDLLIEAFRKG